MTETNVRKVALVYGGGSTLARAVAMEMSRQGLKVALHDDAPGAGERLGEIRDEVAASGGEAAVVEGGAAGAPGAGGVAAAVVEQFGRLDYLINLFVPDPQADDAERVAGYPGVLLDRCRTVGAVMSGGGAIVNHASLPAMYAGTPLEHSMPLLKNGVTGVTRSACLMFARDGVRVNYIQTGFLDLPESRSFASERVRETRVPIGRWSTPEEFARLASFISLRASYMTGQGVILDGGLTAGNAGT